MLPESESRIRKRLGDEDLVLDVGGWASPFDRADWVIDVMPYESRGDGSPRGGARAQDERFDASRWVVRDICSREPWPFAEHQFDFAICSHTLEDVRDPVWVCGELARVARAGYIEVPSRLEEQSLGVHGEWAGYSHHHWLCDVEDGRIEFVFKSAVIHARERFHFPAGFAQSLSPHERVAQLWWEGDFSAAERVLIDTAEHDDYLGSFVAAHLRGREPSAPPGRRAARRRLSSWLRG